MKLLTAVCAILLAGVITASDVNMESGEEFAFTILVFPSTVKSCHLVTPAGDTLDFIPGEPSQYGDRYELVEINELLPSCSVMVKNLQESDSGTWQVSYVPTSGIGGSLTYFLTVTQKEVQEEIDDDTWLDRIHYRVRTGQIIDISLPKIEHDEDCTVRSSEGNFKASEVNIEGVTVHDSSDFVSCRISIGPMVQSLLGDWFVCGTYTKDGQEHERCQPATVSWNNVIRPDTVWHTSTQPQFEHPVHYGHTLTPTVIGSGNVESCHIVTPNGEDLVITQDSEYPHIKAVNIAHSICNIAIGPIDATFLGNWIIYGKFRNSVDGLNEVRLPIHMFLYDEENPYNQAYNVTVLETARRVVNLGNTLYAEVSFNSGQMDNCQFETPSGHIYDMENHDSFTGASIVIGEDTGIACQVAIGPITEDLLGSWKLIGKFSNNGVFTELQQTFLVVQEDPENPTEEDREIHYFVPQVLDTEIGNAHRLVINSDVFIHGESCHIRTPDGLQYTLMEGFSIEGIEVIEETGVECGVMVNVISEDIIGEWTLIARATRFSEPIERRLPFTIYVEESVEAVANEISLNEGNDLYVRLRHATDLHETCKLIGPYGFECPSAERDPMHVETCGFVRRNVQTFNTGTWTIVYGNRTIYKAEIVVTVNPNIETEAFMTTLDLLRDRSVQKAVGPENAVYCRLEDPQGFAVFDGFGRCNLALDKVGLEHHGVWKMFIGAPGRVLTDEYQLYVNVRESEGKTIVTTHVEKQNPIVIVTCAVQTETEVHACKFRDPQGRILLAASASSEDRYVSHGNEVSYETDVKTHECGIRITNPLVSDLGLWRCAIETSEDTYYGFMDVLCPWALQDPAVAATVQQEPILTTDRSLVNVVEEEPATMSCSVQAAIRYCYFRAANGTTFTVTPGMTSSAMEYVGAGFDAGECGVRFHSMRPADSGRWSCHVGLLRDHEEQRDQFQVTVHERMRVNHYYTHGNVMTVEGIVHEARALEYCRFVRIDGFGFTTENVPAEYVLTGLIANGECQFTARNPTILDLHPWTIVAKVRGQDVEIAKDTMEAILIVAPTPEESAPESHEPGVVNNQRGLQVFFYSFMGVLLVAVLLGVWLGPKKNREWTYQRASAFRRSLSSSFRKQQNLPTSNQHV